VCVCVYESVCPRWLLKSQSSILEGKWEDSNSKGTGFEKHKLPVTEFPPYVFNTLQHTLMAVFSLQMFNVKSLGLS